MAQCFQEVQKKILMHMKDFFELVVEGYVVCAVMEYLKMDSVSAPPSQHVIPHRDSMWMEDDSKQISVITNVALNVARQHIN